MVDEEQLVQAYGPNPLHVKQLRSQIKQVLTVKPKQVPDGQLAKH